MKLRSLVSHKTHETSPTASNLRLGFDEDGKDKEAKELKEAKVPPLDIENCERVEMSKTCHSMSQCIL